MPAVERVLRATRGGAAALRVLGRAARTYGAVPPAGRAFRLLVRRGFDAEEAFELGLLAPDLPPEASEAYASKRSVLRLQKALNPERWSRLVQDKGLFYRYCEAAGLPVPGLLALFFRDVPGWSARSGPLRDRPAWEGFLDDGLPSEVVVKPCLGYHGHRVRVLERVADGFAEAAGRRWSRRELIEALATDPEFDAFLFQERLRNHRDLVELAGTDFLQTVRVTTLVDGDGRPRLLDAVLKPIVGNNPTDNYRAGGSGNLAARVDLETGALAAAAIAPPGGEGVRRVPRHPDTGRSIEGFVLPGWAETRELAAAAADRFLPIRTIGWDIAVTPSGPVLVEGNVWWDPPNPVGGMGALAAALRSEVQGHADRNAVA